MSSKGFGFPEYTNEPSSGNSYDNGYSVTGYGNNVPLWYTYGYGKKGRKLYKNALKKRSKRKSRKRTKSRKRM
jgi:hypothetical protein